MFAFLMKPFKNDELLLTVHMAVESHRLNGFRMTPESRSPAPGDLTLPEAMGSSRPIRRIIDDVERVAPTEFTVIFTGETGVGKELVARTIHQSSPRAAAPFVPVDCGSLPTGLIESELFGHERGSFTGADRTRPGCFEAAAGGTLFLDEITNLPLTLQAKLLRALQERRILRVGGTTPIQLNVRVLAATNECVESLVASGRFRRDLYHRLNEFAIAVPSLRGPERRPCLPRPAVPEVNLPGAPARSSRSIPPPWTICAATPGPGMFASSAMSSAGRCFWPIRPSAESTFDWNRTPRRPISCTATTPAPDVLDPRTLASRCGRSSASVYRRPSDKC